MAYISYITLWESKFGDIVSKRDKSQDINFNQLKLEVHDSYEDEKIRTNLEPVNSEDVINKTYLDKNLSRINGHWSFLEKSYNELKLHYNKQSVEEILFQRALKTIIQILYDKRLFDCFCKTDEILGEFLFVTRLTSDLEEVNYDIQWFYS